MMKQVWLTNSLNILNFLLKQWLLKAGPWTNSISITWECVRNSYFCPALTGLVEQKKSKDSGRAMEHTSRLLPFPFMSLHHCLSIQISIRLSSITRTEMPTQTTLNHRHLLSPVTKVQDNRFFRWVWVRLFLCRSPTSVLLQISTLSSGWLLSW